MRHLTLALSLVTNLIFAPFAHAQTPAPSCAPWLKAYVKVKVRTGDVVKEKYEVFEVSNWNSDQYYDGLVLVQRPPNAKKISLTLTFSSDRSKSGQGQTANKLRPFPGDNRFTYFSDFRAQDFFDFPETGDYSLSLHSGDQTVCQQSFRYGFGD